MGQSSIHLMGIEFAPLNVPIERRLQTLAAGAWFVTFTFVPFICVLATIYVIVFTKYTYLALLYVSWLIYDRKCGHQGGRRIEYIRNWTWWYYLHSYFPLKLHKTTQLAPDKNYLFCSYPHGMLCSGAFGAFATNYSDFSSLFPGLNAHMLTINPAFHIPIFREMLLGLGLCAASKESMVHLLNDRTSAKAVVLMVGGASEALKCQPKTNRILLKKRRGFIKLALQTGTSLVPVFSFGETDLYDQVASPPGSLLRIVQDAVRKVLGIAPCIPIGRGFLQYSFGIVPRRHPVNTVVGKPIEVPKTDCPSSEMIESIHAKFTSELVALYADNKHKFEEDPSNSCLIIE